MRPLFLASSLVVVAACSSDPVSSAPDAAPAPDAAVASDAAREAAPPDAASCKLISPYSSKNAACNACAESACCALVNACLGDPRCNDDYVNCILACALLPADAGPDAAGVAKDCIAKCGADFPVGRKAYDDAIACVDGACKGTCQ